MSASESLSGIDTQTLRDALDRKLEEIFGKDEQESERIPGFIGEQFPNLQELTRYALIRIIDYIPDTWDEHHIGAWCTGFIVGIITIADAAEIAGLEAQLNRENT